MPCRSENNQPILSITNAMTFSGGVVSTNTNTRRRRSRRAKFCRNCTNVADEDQYCKARSREEWIAGVDAIRKSGAPVKDHTTTRCPDGRIALPVSIVRLDPYETVSYRTTAGKDTL